MEATLKFNLPEDDYEWKIVSKALEYHNVLSNVDEFLRGQIKYAEHLPEKLEVYSEIREKLITEMIDRNISLL